MSKSYRVYLLQYIFKKSKYQGPTFVLKAKALCFSHFWVNSRDLPSICSARLYACEH